MELWLSVITLPSQLSVELLVGKCGVYHVGQELHFTRYVKENQKPH